MALFGLLGGGSGVNIPNIKRPSDPTYMGITGPEGQLQSQYSFAQRPRGEFEQMLRERAMSQTPSASTMQQVGQAGQLAQTGMAQGISNLAQRGGVSGGARERLAKAASLQGMLGKQNALAAGEEQKLGLQQGIAGQDVQAGMQDVNSMIQNRQGQNQFNLDQYKAKLAEYAGAQLGRQQMAMSEREGQKNMLGTLGSVGGMVAGGMLGGPMGAMAGSSLGGMFGRGIA